MIRACRLVKARYAAAAFDGEGARLNGGRWNSAGTRVAYVSDSLALAMLEVLVHLRAPAVLASYSVASVQFPETLVEDLDVAGLPRHWRRYPAPAETRAVGDQWVKRLRSAVLSVPSALVPSARNFLLNPAHPAFTKIIIERPEPFEWDPRIVGS